MGRKASQMRNDGECYSFDEIMQWVESEYSGRFSGLQSLSERPFRVVFY